MDDEMNRTTPIARRDSEAGGFTPLARLAWALLPLLVGHGAAAELDPRVIPPPELFRQLQLITLECSRENTDDGCVRARREADRLLDHPRVSAGCKDVLWRIVQKAETASRNSMERREEIDAAAWDLTRVCRQGVGPDPEPAGEVTR